MKTKAQNFKIGDFVKIREDVDNFYLQVALLDETDKGIECEIIAFDDDCNEGLDILMCEIDERDHEKWVKSEWLERV